MTPALNRPRRSIAAGRSKDAGIADVHVPPHPEQAAARVPVFQFWLTAFGAALLIWLDSKGVFDGLGAWFGRVLRDTAVGDLIRKFM